MAKLSEISIDDVKDYIRVEDNEDNLIISDIMVAAKGYIYSYTGLTAEKADLIPEFSIAFKCLCGDMYDVRTAAVSSEKENPIVKTILNMHRVNLLGGV